MTTETIAAPLEVAKMVEDLNFWFEERIEALCDITDSEFPIALASSDGGQVKLNDAQSAIFKQGIKFAIELIGKFPLSLDRPTDQPFDVDSVEEN